MNITIVPSSVGEHEPRQFLTSFLINDTVAIDAGCLGFYRHAHDQARIKHVFLTHTHIDHIASLPIFVENAYEGRPECVTIHGTPEVLDCLRRDMFNDRVWPDFIRLSRPEAPFLKLSPLRHFEPVEVEGLRLTPVPVNHVVPTVGYLLEDADATVAFSSDTGPTDELWRRASAAANLKAVFLEATFPNELAWLADVSKHLTPAMFASEIDKIRKSVPITVVHIKPRFYRQVVDELNSLKLGTVAIGVNGGTYTY